MLVKPYARQSYALDQQINDRGIAVDMDLVEAAIQMAQEETERLLDRARELTGLDNPKSVAQLRKWLTDEGIQTESLTKKDVAALLKTTDDAVVTEVLTLRQMLAKSSVTKYIAIRDAVCEDGRVRGLFQFYGASRTGRFAGRLVQVQNLPQNKLKDLDLARQLVLQGCRQKVELFFGNVFDTLSQLIRTAFVGEPTLTVADFSAIEARVVAWLCGEQWRLEVFNTHGKIYEASASAMFNEPLENFWAYEAQKKKHPLRQKGKVAELSCQYGTGPQGLILMGALDMGVKEEELQPLIDKWRAANPSIVKTWYALERAAKDTIRTRKSNKCGYVEFKFSKGCLLMVLPNRERALTYRNARLDPSGQIVFWGVDSVTKKWCEQRTWGSKLLENAAQAISWDYLMTSMLAMSDLPIVMHVHDEIVVEGDHMERMLEVMGRPMPWAPGLTMKAEGYLTKYYRKDD